MVIVVSCGPGSDCGGPLVVLVACFWLWCPVSSGDQYLVVVVMAYRYRWGPCVMG